MPGKKVVIVGEVYDPTLVPGLPLPPDGTTPPQPPGIWGPPGPWPTPPIFIPPGSTGDGPNVPAHPIVLPPPGSGNVPAHPIVLPPVPPVAPGFPAHPIVIPPGSIDGEHPAHPIVIPPPVPPDSGNVPSHPIYIRQTRSARASRHIPSTFRRVLREYPRTRSCCRQILPMAGRRSLRRCSTSGT